MVILSCDIGCTAMQNTNKTQRGAGIGIAAAVIADEPVVLIAIPVTQILATVTVERVTASGGDYRDLRICPGGPAS